VRRLLGARAKPQLATTQELEGLGLKHGTINPFRAVHETGSAGPGATGHAMDVFDLDILSRSPSPDTMMTNAGSLTWAVEFNPAELIAAIAKTREGVLVGDVGVPEASVTRPS
jgi:hypothetical protein